jgi:hypothetical protein
MNGNGSRFMNGKTAKSPADGDLMVIAERELGAFIRAVTELFGPACKAAEYQRGPSNARLTPKYRRYRRPIVWA